MESTGPPIAGPDGKFLVSYPSLPEELREAVDRARELEALGVEAQKTAEAWKREGYEDSAVKSQLELAQTKLRGVALMLARLWIHYGEPPPADLTFDRIQVSDR